MESKNTSLTFFSDQGFPDGGCAAGPVAAEAAHKTMAEVDQYSKDKGNDMHLISADFENDAVNHLRMNGIGSTSSLETAKTKENLSIHSEAPTVPEASGDEGPKDTAKPNSLADKSVQDHAVKAENSLLTNGISTNPDSGNHTITPIPLVNGYEEDTGAAEIHSGSQNDIWSPATKLKHRLEKTNDLIVCPGVYDGFSARIALSVGFDTMYMV